MSRLGRNFRRAAAQVPTLVQRAINTLRKYGTAAHYWDFGISQEKLAYGAGYPNVYLSGELVTNGDFSNGVTGWTNIGAGSVTNVSGALRVANDGLTTWSGAVSTTIPLVVGKTYMLVYTVSNKGVQTNGCGPAEANDNTLQFIPSGLDYYYPNANGTYRAFFKVIGATTTIRFIAGQEVTATCDFDNISVKEVYSSAAAEFLARYPLHHLYQDSAGTLPLYAIGQPCGLVLDQGSGSVVLGAELVTNGDNETSFVTYIYVANGSFARDTTKYKTGTASAKFTANSATSIHHQVSFRTIPANKSIIVEYDYFVPTGSITVCRAFDNTDGSWFTNATNGSVKDQWVRVREFRAAKASAWDLAIGNNAYQSIDGQSFWLDNISVREVIGAHASQSTTTNRPILSNKFNLLLNTETLPTQSVTTGAVPYVLSFTGTGTITLSGTSTVVLAGTGAANRVSVTFTPTAGSLTLTVSGSVTKAQLEVV